MCRRFPALISSMTVNVFDEWAPTALYEVAVKYLQDGELKLSRNGWGELLKVCQRSD